MMIEPNNSLDYIMNYYSIKKLNNYDPYIKYINSKNDLIYLKMYEDNATTLTPDPVYARFHYSHPPASERLARMSV